MNKIQRKMEETSEYLKINNEEIESTVIQQFGSGNMNEILKLGGHTIHKSNISLQWANK